MTLSACALERIAKGFLHQLDTAKRNVTEVQLEVQSLKREIRKAVVGFRRSGKGERENYALAMKQSSRRVHSLLSQDLLASVAKLLIILRGET